MSRGCSVEGCDAPHEARGFCNRHYLRFKKSGSTESTALTLERRFWSKVQIAGPDECWLWGARCDRNGYGRFSVGGRAGGMQMAHRVAWQITNGPVPDGLQIDHVRSRGCAHRNCVNPAHLEPVTPKVNSRRSTAGAVNAARQRAITSCPSNHPYDASNTSVRPDGRRRCKACERERAATYRAAHRGAA